MSGNHKGGNDSWLYQRRYGRDIPFKIVLLGDDSVSKSCILVRLVKGKFESQWATIGADFFNYTAQGQDGRSVKCQIWDTAGQERYDEMTRVCYRKAQAAVVLYDYSRARTFDKAKFWVKELMEKGPKNIMIVLAGSKADLDAKDREVKAEEALDYAKWNGLIFMEVSAMTGLGIHEMFTMIANELVSRHDESQGEGQGDQGEGQGAQGKGQGAQGKGQDAQVEGQSKGRGQCQIV